MSLQWNQRTHPFGIGATKVPNQIKQLFFYEITKDYFYPHKLLLNRPAHKKHEYHRDAALKKHLYSRRQRGIFSRFRSLHFRQLPLFKSIVMMTSSRQDFVLPPTTETDQEVLLLEDAKDTKQQKLVLDREIAESTEEDLIPPPLVFLEEQAMPVRNMYFCRFVLTFSVVVISMAWIFSNASCKTREWIPTPEAELLKIEASGHASEGYAGNNTTSSASISAGQIQFDFIHKQGRIKPKQENPFTESNHVNSKRRHHYLGPIQCAENPDTACNTDVTFVSPILDSSPPHPRFEQMPTVLSGTRNFDFWYEIRHFNVDDCFE